MSHRLASRLTWLVALVLLLGVSTAFAQLETGQIAGSVMDQSGGVIPNASVTITDQGSKTTRSQSTSAGQFVFPNLLAGRYEVTATAPNFETAKLIVNVDVSSRSVADFKLKVGSTTQVVEVEEAAVQVNTETQSVGQNITSTEIVDIPTITRNPYDLVATVGNVNFTSTTTTRGVGLSINGQRDSDNQVLLDGVPNVNHFDTTVAVTVPLDSVGEMNVQTGNFTAEYGKSLGGVVNVDTKRGTNAIHGTAYEFNRVSALASNSFDNNANGIAKSHFTRNAFGGSIGGPIKKNKLFVFFNPEWTRVRSFGIQTAVIATPQLIAASAPATQAFFSALGKQASNLTMLQTFTRGAVCTTGACTSIAASTPIFQKVAYSIPLDSGGGSPQNTYNLVGRVDYVANDRTQFYYRYARLDGSYFDGTVNSSPYTGYSTGESFLTNSDVLSATHLFSPTLVSQTKLSYNRVGITQPLGAAPITPTLYTTASATNSLGGAAIVYPGYNAFTPGNSIPFGGPQNYLQLNQDFTKVLGKHNIRFGGLITYLQDNRMFGAYEAPVGALGTNTSSSVNALIGGTLASFQGAIYPQGKFPCINGPKGAIVTPDCTLNLPVGAPDFTRSDRDHEAALYVQDAWKVRPRLTLNLGLRWEYFGPQANGNPSKDSNFYLGTGANIELQSGTGQVLSSTDPKNPIGGLWAKDWHDFAPRIGLAWDVFGDGKTSLRGGYGLTWDQNFGNVTFNVIQNPPNYAVVNLVAGADVPSIPISTNPAGPFAGSTGTKALGRVTLRAVDPNIKTARADLWSAVLEHKFTNDFIGALEYSGSRGSNLYSIYRLNIPGSAAVYGGPGAGTGSSSDRINPQYSYINFRGNGGFSSYNGLNTRIEMRNFRNKGLMLRLNYTWSHAIDNLSSAFSETGQLAASGNLGFLDPMNPGLDKGSADFDARHRVALVAIYDEPFKSSNKLADAVLGGWSLVPNISAQTGNPFTVFDCTNAAYVYCPRVMYDKPFQATYTQTPTANPNEFTYMNLGSPDSNYVNPKAGVSDFGPFPNTMTGRNVFRGPGAWNVNMAVYKSFKLNERFKMQLRGEAFNAFNHSNLGIVYSNNDASGTSNVTAQKVGAVRNIQLAVKILF